VSAALHVFFEGESEVSPHAGLEERRKRVEILQFFFFCSLSLHFKKLAGVGTGRGGSRSESFALRQGRKEKRQLCGNDMSHILMNPL